MTAPACSPAGTMLFAPLISQLPPLSRVAVVSTCDRR
jgi:hypothetical protein